MPVVVQGSVAKLVPISGPPLAPVELTPRSGGLVLGRQEQSDLRLTADTVSRAHARLLSDSGRWRIIDLKSRWGTFVNGVRVPAEQEVPLSDGDLVRINPWTFRFTTAAAGGGERPTTYLDSLDDSLQSATMIQTISADRLPSLSEELLALLLESATGVHAAPDEKSLGELVLEKACQGTGMPNAALLRPVNDAGRYEVIASRGPIASDEASFSRSLLAAAAGGDVAELSGASPTNISESIINMGVRSALCVPIQLGQTVAAFLYLDARSNRAAGRFQPLRPKASGYCMALARMAGLALANLKRVEMERRSAQLEADLKAAALAQQWILPRRQGEISPFHYSALCRPGRHVGGDFYDIIPLSGDRLAIAIGDVSGKGLGASVLMTASQGFLHAALAESGNPEAAVTRLNEFIHARTQSDKFVTLWVGVLDPASKTLRYVDAGHGYAMAGEQPAAATLRRLPLGEQYPVGVEPGTAYAAQCLPLPDHGSALLLSDGIIEQPASPDSGSVAPFGMAGVERVLSALQSEADVVTALFEAVERHADRPALADDATAVWVRW